MRYQEKKRYRKIENFLQQVKQGPYYICTIWHRSRYQRSVRLFKPEKYHVLTTDLYHPVKSYDEKFYICETCHKHLHKNEIPCQAVSNKMALDPIPDEIRHLRKLEKVLISKRLLFKKIAIMHGKGEFSKIKGSICNIPVETANICNILPRPAVSNGIIVVKLKRDVKNRGHVYFEPVRPTIIYQALTYLKLHNKFYKDISIVKGLSSEDMFKFSDIVEIQGETGSVTEKNISDGKEMIENVNYNRSETEFASVEDPLKMYRTASNETTLVSEIPNIINEGNVIIAPGQGKITVSILRDEFCEKQAFPHLLPKGKFGYNVPRDIPLSPARYFN